jgi:hypothetical protein
LYLVFKGIYSGKDLQKSLALWFAGVVVAIGIYNYFLGVFDLSRSAFVIALGLLAFACLISFIKRHPQHGSLAAVGVIALVVASRIIDISATSIALIIVVGLLVMDLATVAFRKI